MKRIFGVGLLLSLSILPGCSSKSPDEPTELMDKTEKEQREIALDTPENELLETGKKYFNSELYSLARQNFEALKTGYPNSSSVDFSEIKIADCMFETGSYTEAAKAYEAFVRVHPTHPSASYMLYRAARSTQLSYTGVGRDPAPLRRAIDLVDRLVKEYPHSPYETPALENKREMFENLVEHEKRISHFYEKKNFDSAADARDKDISTKLAPTLSKLPKETGSQDSAASVPEGVSVNEAIKKSAQKSDQ